ncbi:MAG: DUF456 domain-containing protein [bacterium]|jgi:uncharacterized protein YqgC (DUF456 family)
MMDVFLIPGAVIMMLLGLAGIFLPVLPGLVLLFAGMALYGYATGFAAVDTGFLLLMLLLTLTGAALDYFAAAAGARKFGASTAGTLGAFLGGIAGIFLVPPFGLILGPFAGAFLGEILASRKSAEQAVRAGAGTVFGIIAGVAMKMVLAAVMLFLFITRIRS